jgi:tRNA A58 N-methylase Trm61
MMKSEKMSLWLKTLADALGQGGLVRIALNKPTSDTDDLKSIDIKPVQIKNQVKLSFTYHHKTNDLIKNYTLDEAKALLTTYLSEKFANARLFTLESDWQLTRQGEGHAIHKHPPSEKNAPKFTHNRAKNHIIKSSDKGWMFGLGLSDQSGAILPTAQDKFRQINKYIEILHALIKQLPEHETLRIVDMGSGKGYLTFALYDYMMNTLKRRAIVTGVEMRSDLVKTCNTIAEICGFTNLKFVQGAIENYDCQNANIVIALHACDTATDDALFKAITAKADLIIVAPCCHKQVRREIESGQGASDHDLNFLMCYGTYVEQISEMLTDGLRAQLLELSGYKTNVFEFISNNHTPKNMMITALRQEEPTPNNSAILASISKTKARFGIQKLHLQELLFPKHAHQ